MSGLITWLQGKKSYIVMILGFVFNFGVLIGWWTLDSQAWALINTILGFLGIGSIRAGMKTETKKIGQ